MKSPSETTPLVPPDSFVPSELGSAAPTKDATDSKDNGATHTPVGSAPTFDDLANDTPVETLGKYHSIAQLGTGGMSKVHLAVVRGPAGFHKLVVLKQLTASLSNSEYLPMFLDEARLAARLNHPNVVQTNEVGQSGDAHFIAMEYLDGQPLTNVLRRTSLRGGLPLPFALRIVADACAGLHHVHELRDFDGSPLHVVHRDVSPQNIFVTYEGHTKVVDFGIAKAEGRSVVTRPGVLKGKVSYMAPEQARGEPLDRRADVFALGVVLYEAVATRRLWRDKDVDILQELAAGRVPTSPKEVRPELPDAIDRICRRALAPVAADRYATALEMQRDLEECLDTMTPHATPRALGELVTGLFEGERQRIHAIIEQQIRKLELIVSGAASSPHLSIPALPFGSTTTPPAAPPSEPSLGADARKRKTVVWSSVGGGAALLVAIVLLLAFSRSPGEHGASKTAPLIPRAELQGQPATTRAWGAAATSQGPTPARLEEPRVLAPIAEPLPVRVVQAVRKPAATSTAEQRMPRMTPLAAQVQADSDRDDPLADRK